jgi:hypothetical protein
MIRIWLRFRADAHCAGGAMPRTVARLSIAGAFVAAMLASSNAARADDIEIGDKHEEELKKEDPGASSPARPEVDAASEPPKKEDENDPDKKFTVGGYIETFYQWNFNVPGNGISAYRGYDTRHNSLTLQNAVIDVGFRAKDLLARVALQVGHAPATIYQEEPDAPGSDTVAPSNGQLWQYLQRASLGWQTSKLLLLEAGLFPSVTGVESLAVKENWNWSRSTASVRLPNYHAGIRATWNVSDRVDVFTAVTNGWNNVVDNNDEKSVIVGAHYKYEKKLTLSGSYFGGIERDGGAPEGRAWRHGFETWAQLDATDNLSFAADSSAGFEQTRFGVAWWASAAAYARVKLAEWLFVAARGDRTWEDTASNATGTSEPMLIPAKHITSGTGTVEVRPVKGFSTRLEFRHDESNEQLFFRGNVQGDGSAQAPYVPNAKYQNSLLLGVVAWF